MARWIGCPYAGDYPFDPDRVRQHWLRLHRGDAEPLPMSDAVLEAWTHFHRGEFEQAVQAGLAAGGAGLTVANKAQALHATYLEPRQQSRLELFLDVARRAEAQAAAEPENPNAWFLYAYALGRYSQGVNVAKALAQGLGPKVRDALERTIALQPLHADAHVALGTFHAEVIDKVGAMIGNMTYGASRERGLQLFNEGLRLNPDSPIALIEYAAGLLMLEGDACQEEASRLYERAAACQPQDAVERLHVERARLELQE